MSKRTLRAYGLILGGFAMAATGCGESIVSALSKIAGGHICQLSANEIKILNSSAIDLAAQQNPPVTVPTLTDAQAQAVSDFLKLNNFCTIEDLEGLPARARAGEQFQGVDELAAAFGNVDPDSIDADTLSAILASTLGVHEAS